MMTRATKRATKRKTKTMTTRLRGHIKHTHTHGGGSGAPTPIGSDQSGWPGKELTRAAAEG